MWKKLLASAGTAMVLIVLPASPLKDSGREAAEIKRIRHMTATDVFADSLKEAKAPKITSSTKRNSEKKTIHLNVGEGYLLAKIAMAEAEGEDTEGKALVILTVLNRVASKNFPDSIAEVIYQEGQFSPVSNGRFDVVNPDKDCWEALDLVMGGWNHSHEALYFESESASTWHRDNLRFLFRHGNHLFYAEE